MSWAAGPGALELQAPACPAPRACAAVPGPSDSWLRPQRWDTRAFVCPRRSVSKHFPPFRSVTSPECRLGKRESLRPGPSVAAILGAGPRSPRPAVGCTPSVPALPAGRGRRPRAPGAGFTVGEARAAGRRWACLRAGGLVCILAMGFWGPPQRAPRSSRPGCRRREPVSLVHHAGDSGRPGSALGTSRLSRGRELHPR